MSYGFEKKAKAHGIKRVLNALNYSYEGLKAASDEMGFRELLILHSFLLISLIFLKFSLAIKMILILTSFLSLLCELFNTAIEAAIDHTSLEKHPLAKRGKDVASAAQFTSLGLVGVLWIMALVN